MTQNIESNGNNEIREAIREHFLHIRNPKPLTSQEDLPKSPFYSVLKDYEEALALDANYYRDYPEDLIKIGRDGLLGMRGAINRFQFQTQADESTVWGIEMRIKKPRNSSFWIPQSSSFVRMLRSQAPLMKNTWISEARFLYPLVSTGESSHYDATTLEDRLVSYTQIYSTETGQIESLHFMARDELGSVLTQKVELSVNESSSEYPLMTSITIDFIKSILGQLPFDKIEPS